MLVLRHTPVRRMSIAARVLLTVVVSPLASLFLYAGVVRTSTPSEVVSQIATPNPTPSRTPYPPPSLFSLFMADLKPSNGITTTGATEVPLGNPFKLKGSVVRKYLLVPFNVYHDVNANVVLVSFYVPHIDERVAVIRQIVGDYLAVIKATDRGVAAKEKGAGDEGDPTDTRQAKPSSTVYVYHDDFLSFAQQGGLVQFFETKGAHLILRGPEYATAAYDAIRAGDSTPPPVETESPTIDCQERHFTTVTLPTHKTFSFVCRKAMVITMPDEKKT